MSACTSSVSAALHVPGRWTLALSDDRHGVVEVGGRVDVDVADARRGVDDRHGRDRHERLLEALSPARDDQVDDAALRGELGELLAPAAGDEPTARRGQPGRRDGVARRSPASTAFECAADDEPRSTIALPDFRHSAAQSIVTFGRDS